MIEFYLDKQMFSTCMPGCQAMIYNVWPQGKQSVPVNKPTCYRHWEITKRKRPRNMFFTRFPPPSLASSLWRRLGGWGWGGETLAPFSSPILTATRVAPRQAHATMMKVLAVPWRFTSRGELQNAVFDGHGRKGQRPPCDRWCLWCVLSALLAARAAKIRQLFFDP